MIVLDGNCALGCGPGTDYPLIHILQCMLERTDAITNEVLEPITFVLAYPNVFYSSPLTVPLAHPHTSPEPSPLYAVQADGQRRVIL
jgi:hypothetical protein